MTPFFNLLAEVTKYSEYYNENNPLKNKSINFQISPNEEHFKYLHEYNKLNTLYRFVQDDEGLFVTYQKEAKILWGLFAFIDIEGIYKDKLRYLFGPFDNNINDPSLHPHFLIKVFSRDDNDNFIPETKEYVMNLAKIAYFVRQHEAGEHEFIQFFKNKLGDASDFEKENEILFIPSEEIDYFILKELSAWCDEKGNISLQKFKDYYNQKIHPKVIKKYSIDMPFCDNKDEISWDDICKNLGINNTENPRYKHLVEYIKKITKQECHEICYKKFKNYIFPHELRFSLPIHIFSRLSQRKYIQKHRRSILIFPIAKQPGDNDLVGFAMLVIEDDENNNKETLKLKITQIKTIMGLLGEAEYREVYLHGLAKANKNNIKRQAIKAAISQVMARNGSHNIGSHVLSRLVTKDNILHLQDEICNRNNLANQYKVLPILSQNQNKTDDSNDYLAYFYSYLKTRMDFLADIATGTPVLENSKLFLQEVIAGFDKNRLLLNRISGINKFNFRFVIKNCSMCNAQGHSLCECTELTTETDIPVAMTNDVLGQHAFYVILENIIRNTAKHANPSELSDEVVFTIELRESELDNSFYEVLIYDNCPLEEEKINELVLKQNTRLNESILNERNNTLRNGNWGLIEMDVSAAYLRKINIEDVDDEKYDIPLSAEDETLCAADSSKAKLLILKAKRKGNFLAYQIYLPKPKEILLIDEQGNQWKNQFYSNDSLDETKLKRLESAGILCLHNSEDIEENTWKLRSNTSYSQQIQILLTPTNQSSDNYLPQRIITKDELLSSYSTYHSLTIENGKEDITFWQLTANPKVFIEEAWRCWAAKKMKQKNIGCISPKNKFSEFVLKTTTQPNDTETLNVALDNHAEHIQTAISNNDFYQEYNHLTIDLARNRINPYLNGIKKPDFSFKELFCFIEGTLSNVLILDERIQQYFYTNKHEKINITIGQIAEKSSIYCPAESMIDLNKQSFPENIRTCLFDEYLKQIFGDTKKIKGLDIVVFHLGVIEKILKAERKEKNDPDVILGFIDEFKEKCKSLFNSVPFIIITSGRGKPDNLPGSIPFLGYSILSQFVIENRYKSLLTQALLSAKPKT